MKENQLNPSVGPEEVSNQPKAQEQANQQQATQQWQQPPYGYPYPPRPRMPRPMYPNPYYGYPYPMPNPQARPMYPYGPQYPYAPQGYPQPIQQPVQQPTQQPVQQAQPNINVNVVPAGYVPSVSVNQVPQQALVVEKTATKEVSPTYPKSKKEIKQERKAAIKAEKELEKEELRKDKLFAKGKFPETKARKKTKKSFPRRLFKFIIILLVVLVILSVITLCLTPLLLRNDSIKSFLLDNAKWLYDFLKTTYKEVHGWIRDNIFKWMKDVVNEIKKYARVNF